MSILDNLFLGISSYQDLYEGEEACFAEQVTIFKFHVLGGMGSGCRPIPRVPVEAERCSPRGACWGTTHAETPSSQLEIGCLGDLAGFFVLTLRVCF